MTNHDPADILAFWFSDRVRPLHFTKDAAFDQEIKSIYHRSYQAARDGTLDAWKQNTHGCLALIILLDQFPRNMFRGTEEAFATDAQAVSLSKHAIHNGMDVALMHEEQVFLHMPLMHSEALEDQDMSVLLYRALGKEDNLGFAEAHRDIIVRFGRFPHRNNIMSRTSTLEEIAFLKQSHSSF